MSSQLSSDAEVVNENPKKGQIGLANLGNTCYVAATTRIILTWPPSAHTYKIKPWLERIQADSPDEDVWLEYITALRAEGLHSGAQDDVIML